jgi:hypothetical protein
MRGLDPRTQAQWLIGGRCVWMAGSSPAMTRTKVEANARSVDKPAPPVYRPHANSKQRSETLARKGRNGEKT